MGALLRSAYCTNIQGIVLIENGSASITPAALKSSAGLAEHLEISIFESSSKAIMAVKEAGYNVSAVGDHATIDNYHDISGLYNQLLCDAAQILKNQYKLM